MKVSRQLTFLKDRISFDRSGRADRVIESAWPFRCRAAHGSSAAGAKARPCGDGRRRYIPWRHDGNLCQDAPRFTAMIAAVQYDVGQHFLSRHQCLIPVGEHEGDGLGRLPRRNGFEIIEIPAIGRCDRGAKFVERRRVLSGVGAVAMACLNQVRREYPRHHMAVIDEPYRGLPFLAVNMRVETRELSSSSSLAQA